MPSLPVYEGAVESVGKVRLVTFAGHEHQYDGIARHMRHSGAIGEHDKARISLEFLGSRNDSAVTRIAFDPSYHGVLLNQDEWNDRRDQIEWLEQNMPGTVDPERRRLRGAMGPHTWLSVVDAYARGLSGAYTSVAKQWMERMGEAGSSVLYDPFIAPAALMLLDPTDAGVQRHLKGVAISAYSLETRAQEERIGDRIALFRKNGIEVRLKAYAGGSFGANTINAPYESHHTLKTGLNAIEEHGLDGQIVHAIGEESILAGLAWLREARHRFGDEGKTYEMHHLEVCTPMVLAELARAAQDIPSLRICPQPNFFPSDYLNYAPQFRKSREAPIFHQFERREQIVPLRLLIDAVGAERVYLGTDGMPHQLAYQLAAATMRAEPEARITLEEAIRLLAPRDKAIPGAREVEIDTDVLVRELNTPLRRQEFLANPYSLDVDKLNRAVVCVLA